MKKTINIVILGLADIAQRFVIPTLLGMPEHFSIKAIISKSGRTTSLFKKKINIIHGDYSEVSSIPNVDAVYIPLPNGLHAKWIEFCLLNKLHVLVEKSLSVSYKQTKKLNDIASKNKLVLLENFQFRFHNQMNVLKNMLSDGEIGKLRCLRSSFGFPPFKDKNNIRYIKDLGGGAVLDAGAYTIKVSQIFLGNDIEVKSSSLFIDPELGIDLWGGAFLKSESSNLFSEIAFGFDNHYQCNLELWGSAGKLSSSRIFTAPPEFKVELLLENGFGKKNIRIDSDNHFEKMLFFFHSLVVGDDDPKNEYKDNINQSRLLEEVFEKSS